MSESKKERQRKGKYRRAKIRHLLFTIGPNRLSGGRMIRRHLSQDVTVREVEIASPLWPAAFDGLRIGHVTDFHLGDLLPVEQAIEIVDLLKAQSPDLIACTGDVVDLHNDMAPPLLEALANANAPMGAYLVLGNHDELHDADRLAQMARDAGIVVLRDEAVEIHRGDGRLTVAGVDWGRTAKICAQKVEMTCGQSTDLLLSHNPKGFKQAATLGIPLTLSGHTHGGQVALREKPNTNLALGHRHSAGIFGYGHSHLYVSVGVGAWFPLRVNCPAEIAMITMRNAVDHLDPHYGDKT